MHNTWSNYWPTPTSPTPYPTSTQHVRYHPPSLHTKSRAYTKWSCAFCTNPPTPTSAPNLLFRSLQVVIMPTISGALSLTHQRCHLPRDSFHEIWEILTKEFGGSFNYFKDKEKQKGPLHWISLSLCIKHSVDNNLTSWTFKFPIRNFLWGNIHQKVDWRRVITVGGVLKVAH